MSASKVKSTFFCRNCGFQSPKWLGKCPSCNEWNSFSEEIVRKSPAGWSARGSSPASVQSVPLKIDDIRAHDQERIDTGDNEFNRILGGGLVPGSLILLGGEPGIGKSTLMLQIAVKQSRLKVLYVSGEESGQQVKMRAERVGVRNPDCFVLSETSLEPILKHISNTAPELVVIDSVQTLYTDTLESSPGSVSQIRECTAALLRVAKESAIPVVLIGHITKDGQIAGPKILEHMVDVVLQFEGDRHHIFRLIRSVKNRFGSTAEIGIYEMVGEGLREVENPSGVLISELNETFSGMAVSATLEGIRPMLVESQALVSTAVYGTPQRSSTGFDLRRLNMLLAVMEKRCGFRLGQKDVFLNITGGLRIEDPAIDLGVICSILSSNQDLPIPAKTCFSGEVGLSGEVRPVNRIEQRIYEAERMGFNQIFLSAYNLKGLDAGKFKIRLVPCAKIEEVFSLLFG